MATSLAASLFADCALLPEGFRRAVRFDIDRDGRFAAVTPEASADGAERLRGPVLPGLVNLHSHAFQRALAGLAERSSADAPAADSFWTWRQVMYRFLAAINPSDLQAIATALYIELLRHGYTTVAEFHYLHHDPDGRPYAEPAELSLRLIDAADTAGIALTLLPVLYAHSGFGGAAPLPAQRRFLHDRDRYAQLVGALHKRAGRAAHVRIGIAPHSLRAVTLSELRDAVAMLDTYRVRHAIRDVGAAMSLPPGDVDAIAKAFQQADLAVMALAEGATKPVATRRASQLALDAPAHRALRLAFGLACAERVRRPLEDADVVACLDALERHVVRHAAQPQADTGADSALDAAAARAAQLANHHPGSRSLDGVGHAAVSASYAVANALAGRALRAAEKAQG